MKNIKTQLGILGGGQLARMMIPTLKKWDISFSILDKENCVSSPVCSSVIVGDYNNADDVSNLMINHDVITFDLEGISLCGIKELESKGQKISPPVSVIETIQDKGKQKEFFKEHNFPTSDFKLFEKGTSKLDVGFIKLRHGGYDGKGVFLWKNEGEYPSDFEAPIVWEEKINVKKEISVLVARNRQGDIKVYEPVEMAFNHDLNLIDYTISPSSLNEKLIKEVSDLARNIADVIKSEGVMAVEFFLTHDNKILVNELAPRPHNSGHHTIESTKCDQFENHIRGVLGYPLGSVEQIHKYTLTYNLLGEGNSGETLVSGIEELLSYDDVSLHLYGKKECRAGRKMGHVTIVADSFEKLMDIYSKIKKIIIIKGK
jgi:5-(carboxyamino)imidazole ribonucleotide synthase